MFFKSKKLEVPGPADALPGRAEAMPVPEKHFVLGTRLAPPFPDGMELAMFGLGCFWGAERKFWEAAGVHSTSVGYAAGSTPNPTYREVCTGLTGHNEVVRVVFDPSRVSYADLVKAFLEVHIEQAPQLIEALRAKGGDDIIVVVGGVVPKQDYKFLTDNGVAAVFGPGTNVLDAARAVLDLLEGKRRNA